MREQRGGESVVVAGMLVLLAIAVLGGGVAVWSWVSVGRERQMAIAVRREAEERLLLAQTALSQPIPSVGNEPAALAGAVGQSATEEAQDAEHVAAIKQVLFDQQTAWNAGDIDGFMEGYWKSDELSFSSGGTTRRSWLTTMEHYKRRYDTRERMGTLTFSELEVHLLCEDAAYVLGRWELKELAGGNFTLVVRKFSEGWRVVHDHTSQSEKSSAE